METTKLSLVSSIKTLRDVVPKRSTVPAAMNILVKNGVMTANNLEMAVSCTLPEAMGEAFLIPEAEFSFLEALPEGDISISYDGKSALSIKAGRVKRKVGTLEPDLFPSDMVLGDDVQSFPMKADAFLGAIGSVLFAAGGPNADRKMQAVCLTGKDGYMEVAALDGHRIAIDRCDCTGADGLVRIVPKAAVAIMAKLPFGEDIIVSLDQKVIRVSDGDITFWARLVEGTYFNYMSMFKMDAPIECEVGAIRFGAALKRAASTTTDLKKPTIFAFSGQEVNVSQASQTGTYEEELPLEVPANKDLKIGFNNSLLSETVKRFVQNGDDKIHLRMTSRKYPVILTGDKSSLLALVLPVNFVD